MKYKLIYDNGKPSEILANSEDILKAELKRIYLNDILKENCDYCDYCDLIILDEQDNDISESQFINEMISDIKDETEQEQETDLNITKICKEVLK